mmetsp:Transcript_108780/g.318252  ORF Transcript_108780/g.318252 Transcript_108780/m.318252 type:complete len:224 (-) Transcript_108780:2-673(-)
MVEVATRRFPREAPPALRHRQRPDGGVRARQLAGGQGAPQLRPPAAFGEVAGPDPHELACRGAGGLRGQPHRDTAGRVGRGVDHLAGRAVELWAAAEAGEVALGRHLGRACAAARQALPRACRRSAAEPQARLDRRGHGAADHGRGVAEEGPRPDGGVQTCDRLPPLLVRKPLVHGPLGNNMCLLLDGFPQTGVVLEVRQVRVLVRHPPPGPFARSALPAERP